MSHFTKVKTEIKSFIRLKEILEELDYLYEQSTDGVAINIRGWNKEETEVLLKIKTGGSYDIGVIKNEDGFYEFVADWWGVETTTGLTQEDFINKITRQYAYATVMEKIRKKGYDLITEEVDEKQNIRIVVRRWE
ncbi:MAG: DUF1257 domain-containing protein [Spirochaetales bacterium]|nr:DUF1257 domain-containing protein [Spirochaetales bacterium]